jgi:hypothetical protein
MTAALAMRAHVPHASLADAQSEAMAKVLTAASRAPLVPMTDQERADLADDDERAEGTPGADFMAWLAEQAPHA